MIIILQYIFTLPRELEQIGTFQMLCGAEKSRDLITIHGLYSNSKTVFHSPHLASLPVECSSQSECLRQLNQNGHKTHHPFAHLCPQRPLQPYYHHNKSHAPSPYDCRSLPPRICLRRRNTNVHCIQEQHI